MKYIIGVFIGVFIFASSVNAVMVGYARNFAIAPVAPSVTSWTNSPAQLTGIWGTSAGATSYNLYVRAGSSPTTSTYDLKYSGVTSPYTVNGPLTEGVTYYAGVTAVNGGGESSMSGTLSAVAAAYVGYTFFGPLGDPPGGLFTVLTAGDSGSAAKDGSGNLSIFSGDISDGSLCYRTNAINLKTVATYKAKMRAVSGSSLTQMRGLSVFDVVAATSPLANDDDVDGWANAQYRGIDKTPFMISSIFIDSGGLKLLFMYAPHNDEFSTRFWDITSGSWLTSGTTWLSVSYDTDYWIYFITSTTGFKYMVKNDTGTTTLLTTTEVPWDTGVKVLQRTPLLYMGDPFTDYHMGKLLLNRYEEL